MSDPTNQTERDQIDVLIGMKKDEIKNLEDLKSQFTDDYLPESQTPAQVAADPDVNSAERAAAANAVLGQDPATVNAEQSLSTPSTHDSVKESASDDTAVEEPTVEDKTDDAKDTEEKPASKKDSSKKS